MNTITERTAIQKLSAIIITIAVFIAMVMPLPVYADESYGMQPSELDSGGNNMQMLVPSDIVMLEKTDTYYLNEIETPIDGASDIRFTFTMSAGMNNFNEDGFKTNNMPVIKIYDEDEENVVAEYSDGNGNLQFLGVNKTGEINNWGGYKSTEVYIGVEEGVLEGGEYVLVFGKDMCGNNTDKKLGKDIKFRFTVQGEFGIPSKTDLTAMLAKADEFSEEVKDKIDDAKPGYYPTSAWETFQQAIADARALENASDSEKKAAAEMLYNALKTFKKTINYEIESITITDMPQGISVGDTGTASADVVSCPDEAQYKKVTWEAVTRPDPDDSSKDEASDNLIINSVTGNWVAAYSGTVWLKATSAKDESVIGYKQVEIKSEPGVIAVNLSDADARVQPLVEKTLQAVGQTVDEITSVKVFTTGEGCMTDEDIDYLKSIPGLKTLDMGQASLKTLKSGAFKEHKSLEKVVLPEDLSVLGQRAFYNCTNLKSIELPASLTKIDGGAFAGCTSMNPVLSVKSVYPPAFTTAGMSTGDAFKGTASDTPSSVTAIRVPYSCGEDYKKQTGWKRFNITETDKKILKVHFTSSGTLADEAEAAMKAQGINEGDVTDLYITSPEDVQLSRSVDVNNYLKTHFLSATTIDLSGTEFEGNKCNANTFKERISLKYIRLPESTTTIGGTCFYGCKNLRSLTLPEGLLNIGSGAFGECNMIGSEVVVGASEPPSSFGTIFPDCVKTLRVPLGCEEAYKAAAGWNVYDIRSQLEISLSSTSLAMEAPSSSTLIANVVVYGNCGDTVFWKSSNTSVATVSPSTGKTVTVKGLKAGTATIMASDVLGNVKATCTVTVKTLAAPATVTAASAAYNKVKVSWSGVSGAQKYQVLRCNKSGTIIKSWTLGSTSRSMTDTGLTTGTTYYYKVRAYKTVSGVNYYGSYSSLKAGVPSLSKPATPSVSKSSKTTVKVKWKGISGETGYQVYRATSKNGKYSKVKSVKMASSKYPYAKIKAKKGKTYYYKVRAYKKVGSNTVYSSFSNPKAYKLK